MVFFVTDGCFEELPLQLRCPLVAAPGLPLLDFADGLALPEEGLRFTGRVFLDLGLGAIAEKQKKSNKNGRRRNTLQQIVTKNHNPEQQYAKQHHRLY
jgi:hypothetical protein